jgi:iron-sulfur cluster repair protein YtfE (RIC family)
VQVARIHPSPVAGAMLQDLREPIHLENHLLFARTINPAA